MANVLVNDASLADIADAIREKNGTEETYKPAEMGAAVRAIESGGGVGIILSDFTGGYSVPQVADLRNIPAVLEDPSDDNFKNSSERFSNMFANNNGNPNAGFYNRLKEVSLPKIYGFSTNMFGFCDKLVNINGDFSELVYISTKAFNNCKALAKLPNMPVLSSIGQQAFYNCSSLTQLKLLNNTVVSLVNVNAFTGTPIASGTGYIYVPKALIDTYKTATNWVTYANQFRALEDYTVDGTITGELDENKI